MRILCEPRRTGTTDQQRGGAAEAGDLLLPLALQRRRTDHQHARNAVEAAQQFCRRNRLDGLAETHVVGQQRALAEREVQHAVALIGQQLMAEDVDRLLTGGDLGLEPRPRLDARGTPARLGEPRFETLRHADLPVRHRCGVRDRMQQRLDPRGRDFREAAVGREERREDCGGLGDHGPVGRPQQPRDRLAGAGQEQFDPRRAEALGSGKRAHAALPQSRQNTLDVLAGAKAVNPMVGAAA